MKSARSSLQELGFIHAALMTVQTRNEPHLQYSQRSRWLLLLTEVGLQTLGHTQLLYEEVFPEAGNAASMLHQKKRTKVLGRKQRLMPECAFQAKAMYPPKILPCLWLRNQHPLGSALLPCFHSHNMQRYGAQSSEWQRTETIPGLW